MDGIDMRKVDAAFQRVVPNLVRSYLSDYGLKITECDGRTCSAESDLCKVIVFIEWTAVVVWLILKPETTQYDRIQIGCQPVRVPDDREIEQEVRRQLQIAVDTYDHILRGEAGV